MKKIGLLLVAAFTLAAGQNANAQIQKGNIMVGAGLANFDFGLQKGASVGVSLHPRVGYFFRDNIAVGALVNFGFDYAKSRGTILDYGVNAFARYYAGSNQVELINHARFFAEANIGPNGRNTIVSGKDNSSTNGLGIGIGPGVAYFLTPNIGLEALAKYNGIVGFGNSATAHSLNIEVGFQIYLSTKKARAIYSEASRDVKRKMKESEESED